MQSSCSSRARLPELVIKQDVVPLYLFNHVLHPPPISHAEHSSCPSSLPPSCFSLHLLADLDIDLEELCDTSIQTDGFSFIEIPFPVICRYAFLRARLIQSANGNQHIFGTQSDLELCYLLNISEIISTSVSAAAIFSAEDSCGFPPKRNDMLGV